MITVIDYGAGNLRSVENALRYLQVPYAITSEAGEVARSSAILLPGVGHFGQMMRSLDRLGLTPVLREAIGCGVPYLGICLGMHALFDGSEEAPTLPGLGIFHGTIRRFPEGLPGQLKVPHMGWNRLRVRPGSRIFEGIDSEPFVYFAHSYYLPVDNGSRHDTDEPTAAALAEYGFPFVAAVERNNIRGVQFHPEKSGQTGIEMIRNFARQTEQAEKQRS